MSGKQRPAARTLSPARAERAVRALALLTAAVLLLGAALAAAALAAKPARGAHFSGRTSVPAILGFRAPVSFTVSQNGRQLNGFSFGTFGCFGAGGFRPGVNPYTGNSILHIGTVKVSASGQISVTGATSKYSVQGQTTVTTISVAGHFTKAKAATGSIKFSQNVTGSVKSSCGPATVGFTASAH
jgi:hypothetical protein